MKTYIKPTLQLVAVSTTPLATSEETVEFRFNTSVNDDWQPDSEHIME